MKTKWKLAMTLALVVGGLGVAATAQAWPANETTTVYYTDPGKHNWCGTKTFTCQAQTEMEGVTGPYWKKYSFPCD